LLFYKSNRTEDGNFFVTSSFDRLAGNDQLRQQIIEGKKPAEIRETWKDDIAKYLVMRNNYVLYPL
jgi:uncharacterized protein YbbC (DUF1343 family)